MKNTEKVKNKNILKNLIREIVTKSKSGNINIKPSSFKARCIKEKNGEQSMRNITKPKLFYDEKWTNPQS